MTPEEKLSLKFGVNEPKCVKFLIDSLISKDSAVSDLAEKILEGYISEESLYYALPELLENKLFRLASKIPTEMLTKDDLVLITRYWRHSSSDGKHQYFDGCLGRFYLDVVADFTPEELGDILQNLITCKWISSEEWKYRKLAVRLIDKVPLSYVVAQLDELVLRKNEYSITAQATSIELVLRVLMSDTFPKKDLARYIQYLFECYLIGGAPNSVNRKNIKALLMGMAVVDLKSSFSSLLSIDELEGKGKSCYTHELIQAKRVSAQLVLKVLQEYEPEELVGHLKYILKWSNSDHAEIAEGYTRLILKIPAECLREEQESIIGCAPDHLKVPLLEELGLVASVRKEIFA